MFRSLSMLLSFLALIIFGVACSDSEPPEMTEEQLMAQAREIHERVLTIDTHDDIPSNFATEEVDPGKRGDQQVDLVKMKEGGLDAGFFIVYVGQTKRTPENYKKTREDAMAKFNAIHRMTDEMYPDRIGLAYTADDVVRIHESGKLVACIGIENGYAIGKDLSLLKKYHELGARYITLTHMGHNDIADSSIPRESLDDPEAEHNGISAFGQKVVEEMNRLGIMVDVSHVSKQTMLDAVKYSRSPVIASHSSTTALCDHPRNMDDEQLMALKANGGVMQTVAFNSYVKKVPEEKTAAVDSLWQQMDIADFEAFMKLSDEKRAAYDLERAKIDLAGRTLTPHCFRHTYVSMARRVLGETTLQQLVGHRSKRVTDGYDHATLADRAAALAPARKALDVLFAEPEE